MIVFDQNGEKAVRLCVEMCKMPSRASTELTLMSLSVTVDTKTYQYAQMAAMLADMEDAHTARC